MPNAENFEWTLGSAILWEAFQHTCWLKHEQNVRAGRTRHLSRKHLEIECPVIIFHMVNALSKYRATSQIDSSGEPVHLTFVQLDLHANASF